jgi:hypothetical protein
MRLHHPLPVQCLEIQCIEFLAVASASIQFVLQLLLPSKSLVPVVQLVRRLTSRVWPIYSTVAHTKYSIPSNSNTVHCEGTLSIGVLLLLGTEALCTAAIQDHI